MKKLKTLEENNRQALEKAQNKKVGIPNGVACPKCGEELHDTNPSQILLSFPAQKQTHCENCGYKGTRFV